MVSSFVAPIISLPFMVTYNIFILKGIRNRDLGRDFHEKLKIIIENNKKN